MYIAIDVGGTNLRVATFDSLDNPQLLNYKSVHTSQSYQESLASIKKLVGETNVEGVGVGVPRPTHLPDWKNHDLKSDLQKIFPSRIVVANDAYVAALGEAVYGKTPEDFLFVTWGTGIGGAFVHDKKVTGTEMGHQIINQNGPLCPCGQRGCLEMEPTVNNFAQGIVNCLVINPVEAVVWAGGKSLHQPEVLMQIEARVLTILKEVPIPKFKLATFADKAGVYGALSLLKSTV